MFGRVIYAESLSLFYGKEIKVKRNQILLFSPPTKPLWRLQRPRRKLGQFVACAVNFKAAEHAGAEEFIGQFKRLSRHCKQNINYRRSRTRSSSIMFH